MKINLPIEEGYFNIVPCVFCDIDSYIITPQADAKWNKNNLHLRSIVVDKDGNVLSCGFFKFFNYGEKTDCYPNPENYFDWIIEEKKDGSLLIVDYVNNQLNIRTRGTTSYKTQKNYKEFEVLLSEYPEIVNYLASNSHLSLLFEMETPSNVIVIRSESIKFTFLNAIDKNTLKMVSAKKVIEIQKNISLPPLPEKYTFADNRNLQNIYSVIKDWKGKEGIVLTYNNGQNKLKFKSDWYLLIHRIKSQLNSTDNLIDYYIKTGMGTFDALFKKIETDYDYEVAFQLKPELYKICKTGEEVKKIIHNMKDFVNSIRNFETRKQQAQHIQTTYGRQERASFAFTLLDKKELDENQVGKLVRQVFLKNI